MLAYILFQICIPRIVSFNINTATSLLDRWSLQTSGLQQRELLRSRTIFEIESSEEDIGCIAVVTDEHIRALALLKQDTDKSFILKDIACLDQSSGTLLMKAVSACGVVHCDPMLNFKWRMAHSYFMD